jgi:hypothetical protein
MAILQTKEDGPVSFIKAAVYVQLTYLNMIQCN